MQSKRRKSDKEKAHLPNLDETQSVFPVSFFTKGQGNAHLINGTHSQWLL